MLGRIGVVLDLTPQGTVGEDFYDLRELLTARRALVKDQITAKTRLATATNPLVREQLCHRIDDIDADIKALDEVIGSQSGLDQEGYSTACIDEHRDEYGVEPICRVLPIAPSTYHEHVASRRDRSRLSLRV